MADQELPGIIGPDPASRPDRWDAQLRAAVLGVQGRRVGSHLHLDRALGEASPSIGDPQWWDVGLRCAQIAGDFEGQFLVTIPLAPWETIPAPVDRDQLGPLSSVQPPAVYVVDDADPLQPGAAEHHTWVLPAPATGVRAFVSAWRSPEELDLGEPLHAAVYLRSW